MRKENSIRNSTIAVLANLVAVVIGFIAQKIFINILGAEYLGINGLFSNILSFLSIAELGVGEAIIFHLYKPIAKNDTETVKSLLHFYKKAYNIIALAILIIGLCIIPFLDFFIGETTVNVNLTIVYILFLFQTVSSYVLTYKRSILYANQKNYVINLIHIIYLFVMNTLQLITLFVSKNYYLYLIIKIICVLLENIVINICTNKMYSYANEKNVKTLDKKIEKDIFAKVKAMFYHKVSTFLVLGTDNILISKFFGVITVGFYSNYYLIINSVKNLFAQFISAITASVGNLLVENNEDKSFDVYRKVKFFNFWIASFSAIGILVVMQSFIKIWIGEQYLLSNYVLYVLVINYYQTSMRSTEQTFLSAAGIWVENRFVPIVESILNILFSIIFLKIFGLVGVFMGTITSSLALWCYSYPKFVYKKIFNRSYLQYAKETIGYLVLFIVIAIITYGISTLITVENSLLQVVINVALCVIIPNLILFVIFRNTDNFKYFKDIITKFFEKIKTIRCKI